MCEWGNGELQYNGKNDGGVGWRFIVILEGEEMMSFCEFLQFGFRLGEWRLQLELLVCVNLKWRRISVGKAEKLWRGICLALSRARGRLGLVVCNTENRRELQTARVEDDRVY